MTNDIYLWNVEMADESSGRSDIYFTILAKTAREAIEIAQASINPEWSVKKVARNGQITNLSRARYVVVLNAEFTPPSTTC